MTADQQIRNLSVLCDRNQFEIATLKARVDELCTKMNQFCADVQGQLVELLQKQDHDIKITTGEKN